MKQNIIKLCSRIALLCILVTSILIVPARAADIPRITASTVKAESGSTVDVVISLDKNPGLWSIGLRVGYDHSALTLTGYNTGNIFTSGEVTPPQSLNKETYFFVASKEGLADTTTTGRLVILTFSIAAKATDKDYPITLELSSGNTINAKSEDVAFTTTNGKVTVVKCIHESSTWTTVTAATCEKSGTKNLICNKCKAVLDTSTVAATEHSYTKKVISDKTKRSNATATEKATYFYTCEHCGDISDTLYFTYGDVTVYTVTNGIGSEWKADKKIGLTFTANGNFEKFTGVKIDGKLVDKKHYDAKSGSTIATLKVDYLKTLKTGNHIITFVYTDGEISTNFKIKEATGSSDSSIGTVKPPSSSDSSIGTVITPSNTDSSEEIVITPSKDDSSEETVKTPSNSDASKETVKTDDNNEASKETLKAGGGSSKIYIISLLIVILCSGAAFVYYKKVRR